MTTTAPTDAPAERALEDGRVVAIAGPVIDVEFPPHALPEINHAVEFEIQLDGQTNTITAEVAQQIGEGRVRCICMQQTDGLVRGAAVRNLGRGIQRARWATPCSGTCSTCSANRSTPTTSARSTTTGRSTATLRPSTSSSRGPRCSRPGSRSSTCSSPTCRAARSASSGVPAWARP